MLLWLTQLEWGLVLSFQKEPGLNLKFSHLICVYFSDPNYNGSLVKAEKTLDMDSSEKEEEQMAGPSSTKHDLPLATFPNAVQGKIILNFLCMLF